jgi:hypothetical protein
MIKEDTASEVAEAATIAHLNLCRLITWTTNSTDTYKAKKSAQQALKSIERASSAQTVGEVLNAAWEMARQAEALRGGVECFLAEVKAA